MNRVAAGRAGVVGFMALAVCIPFLAYAAEYRVGEQQMVGSAEKIAGNLYIAGGTVNVAGAPAGDVVGAGGTVLIGGTIGRDVLLVGGNVTMLGPIAGNARLAGGNVTVQGPIGGDLMAGGGQIIVGSPTIGGDVIIGGGTVTLTSAVTGSVRVAGGDVVIDGPVAGNLYVKAKKVTLKKNAVITGSFIYSAQTEAVLEEGAAVQGATEFTPMTEGADLQNADAETFGFLGSFVSFFMQLACALVVALFFKRYAARLVSHGVTGTIPALGVGFVTLVVWPVAALLLLVTVIGVPLGIMGMLGYILLLMFAWIMAPVVLGAYLHMLLFKPQQHEVSWRTILLGTAVYGILGLIPVVGWIAQFVLILIVLGAVIQIKRSIVREWR